MLNLNSKPKVWIDHEETKTRYFIQAIFPEDNKRLMKRSKGKNGELDGIAHNGLVVDFAVIEWEGVGDNGVPVPPTEENKRKFGEKFATIASFIYSRASDVTLSLDEQEAAKND